MPDVHARLASSCEVFPFTPLKLGRQPPALHHHIFQLDPVLVSVMPVGSWCSENPPANALAISKSYGCSRAQHNVDGLEVHPILHARYDLSEVSKPNPMTLLWREIASKNLQ